MFRHHGMRLLPHVITACAVTILATRTSMGAISHGHTGDRVSGLGKLLLELLILQLALGFTAYLTRVVWNPHAEQPAALMVFSTVAHVSVGALLLATAAVLAIRLSRQAPALQAASPSSPKAATA